MIKKIFKSELRRMVNSAEEKERPCGDSKNLDPSFDHHYTMTEQVYELPTPAPSPLPSPPFKVLFAGKLMTIKTIQKHSFRSKMEGFICGPQKNPCHFPLFPLSFFLSY